MGKNTRYDKLIRRIRRQHSRSQTFENDEIADGERTRIFDLSDPGEITDHFLERGPFNSVVVRNYSSVDIRAYMRSDRGSYVTIPGTTSAPVSVASRIPARYIGFLEIENRAGDGTAVSAGDIEIQVGTEVDTVELELLKMSGLLDIPDATE